MNRRPFLALLVLSILAGACTAEDPPSGSDQPEHDAGPPLNLGFGEPCTRKLDCVSGACVQVAEGRGVCSFSCDALHPCPDVVNWTCGLDESVGVSLCDCRSNSTTEICGDGVDNDCDGIVDCVDDRIPDGGPKPIDCPGAVGCEMTSDDLCALDPALCPTCRTDGDCDDSLDCTRDLCRLRGCVHVPVDTSCAATEVCTLADGCVLGTPCATDLDCVDTNACTRAEHCDPKDRVCRFVILDGDDDERYPASCGGNDCDDSDPFTFGGALEVCDGVDNDCDGVVDPASSALACGEGRACTNGACSCDAQHISCRGRCLPPSEFQADSTNCGACGNVCIPGFQCQAGACVDVNECELQADWCGVHSTCSHPSGAQLPSCTCESGYASSTGANCADVDECANDTDTCDGSPNACVNQTGTFTCACPAGYSGTGVGSVGCIDVDECLLDLDDCTDAPLAICTNTAGSFSCACPSGYTGTGRGVGGCQDRNECSQNSDNCSASPDACVNTDGGFMCTCPAGYTGTGVGVSGCVDADECQLGTHTCHGSLRCVNTVASFGCTATVLQVTSGLIYTCALLEGGLVKCWGTNNTGELGLGDTVTRGDGPGEMGDALPVVDLGTGRTATAVSAGGSHTCALLDDGSVKCWGYNNYGQLGLGDTAARGAGAGQMGDSLAPVDLGTGRTATAVSAGASHTCALLDDGSVKCWGYNLRGQLGLGDAQARGDGASEMGDFLPAVALGSGRTATAVSAGGSHTCVVLDDSSVKCWGYNAYGQLGLGNAVARGDNAGEMADSLPAVALGTGRTAMTISAGGNHTCAVLDDRSVRCWGYSAYGQLGLGNTVARGDNANEMNDLLPAVNLGSGVYALSVHAGQDHTCAVLGYDTVKCWGSGGNGRLGLGNTVNRGDSANEMGDLLPVVAIGTGDTARAVSAGAYHTCALLGRDLVKCWGYNVSGQLGLGDTVTRGDNASEMGDALPVVLLSDLQPGL